MMKLALAMLAIALLPLASHAQLFRAYLASDGSDANPCTLPQPCRLLPAALNAVASGGEIWMLDSANYNTADVYVAKSVSILAVPGAMGSIVSATDFAVVIQAAGLRVSLRNVVVVPLPTSIARAGVFLAAASELNVENSHFSNLSDAITMNATGTIHVSNTTFRNCGGYGVHAAGGGIVSVSGARFLGGLGGVIAEAQGNTVMINVSDSFFAGQSAVAVFAWGIGGGHAHVTLTRSTIDRAHQSLTAQAETGGTAVAAIGGSVISHGHFGWRQVGTGAEVRSLGNNHFEGNNQDDGTLTTITPQ